ncbi:MAG: thermonuclease family protein, partial [Bdellovibrionia bacterium]
SLPTFKALSLPDFSEVTAAGKKLRGLAQRHSRLAIFGVFLVLAAAANVSSQTVNEQSPKAPEVRPLKSRAKAIAQKPIQAIKKSNHVPVIQPIQSTKVVGVVDGDTLDVLYKGHVRRVRLAEIDSPEKGQAFGKRAKQYLANRVHGKTIQLNIDRKDKYGRYISWISLGGKSINREMISKGYAWAYRQYLTEYDLLSIEAQARESHTGLWAQKNPTPPWNYRRVSSNRRYISFE